MQAQKYEFKTVQDDSLQMGKGIVDLVFFGAEEVLVISKIQLALKYESMEFLGIRTIEWVRFPEFGLDVEVWDWTSLSMALMNLSASSSS